MNPKRSILALALAAALLAGCDSAAGSGTQRPAESSPAPLSGVAGIGRTNDTSAWQDDWGVKLTVRDVTPTGLTLVCTQTEDPERGPSGSLQTGSAYVIETLENGEWNELVPAEDWGWTAEAWVIPEDDTVRWTVDWSALYGALPAGSYRIGKTVMDFRAAGDLDETMYYAGFDLVELQDGYTVSAEQNGVRVSVPYVDGWEYCVVEPAEDDGSFGVCWRPVGEDGWVALFWQNGFGVCGTGLKESPFRLDNGTSGQMGVYDNDGVWSFISFSAAHGGFVAQTHGAGGWWAQYGDGAMAILKAADFPAPAESGADA